MGVIRYGPDEVVAVLDSEIAGRNVSEWLPGHDIPIVATLDEALALPEPPTALLIGIAPTGGRLPAGVAGDDPRRRSTPGSTSCRASTTFLGDDPEFAAAAARSGVDDRRLPPATGPHGDGRRPPPRTRQEGDPDRRHGLRDRQDVRRPRAHGGRPARRGWQAVFVPTGQTGMMIEGWGVAVDRLDRRLPPGHLRMARRAGGVAGRLGHRRGPGLAGPPGLFVGHAGAHPRRPRRTRWSWSTSRGSPTTTSITCRTRPFPIAPLRPFIELHEQVAGLVAPSRVVAVALNTSLFPDEAEARRVIERDRRRDRACRAAIPCGSAPSALWAADPGAGRGPAVGRSSAQPGGPASRAPRPVPASPAPTTAPAR